MRIVVMGTGPFAVPTLRKLAESDCELLMVVSRPFRGRRGTPLPPMHLAAAELGLELWTPESINLPESVERLVELNADLLVVCDYGQILRPPVLAATRLGGINLHGSLLPRHRGAAPVQWALLSGDAETGNTVIQMTPGLDAGPCLAQQRVAIDPLEDAGELEARLATLGADAVLQVVRELDSDSASPQPQDAAAASKAPRLEKSQGLIDWNQPAVAIHNQVRALQPWPRTYTFLPLPGREPLRLTIDKTRPAEALGLSTLPPPAAPGTLALADRHLLCATADGWLELLSLQPAGKRQLAPGEFLNGYPQAVGAQLT
jgi:methionyl-tRNA formyltransferase